MRSEGVFIVVAHRDAQGGRSFAAQCVQQQRHRKKKWCGEGVVNCFFKARAHVAGLFGACAHCSALALHLALRTRKGKKKTKNQKKKKKKKKNTTKIKRQEASATHLAFLFPLCPHLKKVSL
jgi:hypothetical protein